MGVARLQRPKKLALLSVSSLGLLMSNLHAATFLVTTNSDSGAGSLRQAIVDANASGGGTIAFSDATGTITLSSDLPTITANTTVVGPGTNMLTISGNNLFRVFAFNSGSTSAVSGLTIADGSLTNDNGAGIRNEGSLIVSNCVLLSNRTLGGFGGAMYNSGNLTIFGSCFVSNSATGGPGFAGGSDGFFSGGPGGGGAGLGGGLFTASAAVQIVNSLFVANQSIGAGGQPNLNPNTGVGNGGNGGGMNGGAGGTKTMNAGNGSFGGGGGGAALGASGGAGGFGGGGGGGSDFSAGGKGGYGGGDGTSGDNSGGGYWTGNGGGGAGFGGVIFVESGSISLLNCRVLTNRAIGGGLDLGGGGFGGVGGSGSGGGVFVMTGTVRAVACTFSSNESVGGDGGTATFGGAGAPGNGAALYLMSGFLAVERSTLANNRSAGGQGGSGSRGGSGPGTANGAGIYADGGSLTFTNVTFSQNRTESGNSGADGGSFTFTKFGGSSFGAAVCVNTGLVFLVNCTVTANEAMGGAGVPDPRLPPIDVAGRGLGGGIANIQGTVHLKNTIIAENSAGPATNSLMDLSGTLLSEGFNLIGDTNGASGLINSDLLNVAANLGPLQDNGGPTFTHALLADSSAIDAGAGNGSPLVDQRGFPRPAGIGYDIGAYEFRSSYSLIRYTNGNAQIWFITEPNQTYPIQATTDFFNWQTIGTVPASPNGQFTFQDATNLPQRFYRLLLSP